MAPDAAAGGAGAGVQGRARAAAENEDAGAEDAAGSSTMRDQVCVCVLRFFIDRADSAAGRQTSCRGSPSQRDEHEGSTEKNSHSALSHSL